MKNAMIKAVLFDFDGVIVDSMKYHVEAWIYTFKKIDIDIETIEFYKYEGSTTREIIRKIFSKKRIRIAEEDVERIAHKRGVHYRENNRTRVFPEIKKNISKLKEKKLKIGMVSGSSLKNIEHVLPKKILESFDVIIKSDDVECGKPDPEPYLKAAQKLKVKPSECLAIENAPLGIKSAKGAGMKCFALTTTLPSKYLKGADLIFKNHDELFSNLEIFF